MSTLDRALRRKLETTIREARDVAEKAAADAIRRLGVADDSAPTYLSAAQKALRVRLRAHARTLGDGWDGAQKRLLTTTQLQEAVAYEAWHRMLFGRFLVERDLLIDPEMGVAIGRDDLRELAQEEGLPDEWALVERLAAPALPAVFRPDDPLLAVPLAPEYAKGLRMLVVGLPEEVFAADDSLGWTYQFWRAAEKDAVNRAGGKIGAAELPAVTQLFTEPYMVKFLLHNTLGAWWAGKVLTENPGLARDAADEQELRDACAHGLEGVAWEFLRFVRDGDGTGPWRPAAGTFPGWPRRSAEITFLDPCAGSGHFLVEAFGLLAALRRAEEGLSGEEVAQAVLRDNLHGLEIDGRCVQIAAFNVALAAWRLAEGPVMLPQPHIAWMGAQPPSLSELAALAGGDRDLHRALEALHDQFAQAPLLGSLLEVGARDLLDADIRERGSLALQKLHEAEPERVEGAIAALGMLDGVSLLRSRYHLAATNFPFLTEIKFSPSLSAALERRPWLGYANLATIFLERTVELLGAGGAAAFVAPQSWWFLKRYSKIRKRLNRDYRIDLLARLGEKAFDSPQAGGELVGLSLISAEPAPQAHRISTIDVSEVKNHRDKSDALAAFSLGAVRRQSLLESEECVIAFSEIDAELPKLAEFATALRGVGTGDSPRFVRNFWELLHLRPDWEFHQTTTSTTEFFSGMQEIIYWQQERGELAELAEQVRHLNHAAQNWRRGKPNWGRVGAVVSQMGSFPASIYTGAIYDPNCCAIVPSNPDLAPAIWAFCASPDFASRVREKNQNRKVEVKTFLDIPFDAEKWRDAAIDQFPNGLPEPYSDDPTQWVFHGHPAHAMPGTELHVALARLAGYRWPAELDTSMRLSSLARERIAAAAALPDADRDGLLPLHATAQDLPLADRLRNLLNVAHNEAWTNARERALIGAADALLDKREARDATLEGWLRDRAFRQHCALFHDRPFLWQVWDGGKGGFSAFLHYHRLDRAALEKLTYTLLGDWTARMKAEGRTAEEGWALQLRQRLVAILEGEKPYDIFVRWKSLGHQPMGWEPDLNDGVRLNIRPFIKTSILRDVPKGINWNKDRGTDQPSAPWFHLGPTVKDKDGKPGDRINDYHLTLADKRAARHKAAE